MSKKMNKVMVKFNVIATQYIDWPEDEMDNFTYDSLECNLDIEADSTLMEIEDITMVEVNNEPHEF